MNCAFAFVTRANVQSWIQAGGTIAQNKVMCFELQPGPVPQPKAALNRPSH